MKTLIIIVLILFSAPTFAQEVERWEYLKVVLVDAGFNSETRVTVDDGSKQLKMFKSLPLLTDSSGNSEFKSPIDAMNFLGNQGWEAVQFAAAKAISGVDQAIIFKRRKR